MSEPTDHLASIQRQFTRQAEAYSRMRQATHEAGLRALVDLSGADASSRVLDVACGPGFLTLAFARKCREAIGLDATDALLERGRSEARSVGIGNVDFRSGNAEQVPFADGEFDVAACRAAFHHFPRPERVLAEMARVTRAGGRLLIGDLVETGDDAQAAYRDRIEKLCDPTHVRALREHELKEMFARNGLEVAQTIHFPMRQEVEEYLDHGGPSEAVRAEIRALLEASMDGDLSGLQVRRESEDLVFTHASAVFVLTRTA